MASAFHDSGGLLVGTPVHALLSDLGKQKKSGFVFPSNRNVGQQFLDLKKGFKKALGFANFSERLRWHDLRHTFASRLVRAGVDLITVQQLLGHAKITMTARNAHSMADDKIDTESKLDFAGSYSSPDSHRTRGPHMPVTETGAKPLQSSTIGP